MLLQILRLYCCCKEHRIFGQKLEAIIVCYPIVPYLVLCRCRCYIRQQACTVPTLPQGAKYFVLSVFVILSQPLNDHLDRAALRAEHGRRHDVAVRARRGVCPGRRRRGRPGPRQLREVPRGAAVAGSQHHDGEGMYVSYSMCLVYRWRKTGYDPGSSYAW